MWHYVQNGQASGPIETVALQSLLSSGAVGPETLVWKQGLSQWTPARSAPELAGFIPPAGGPPPIPPLLMQPLAPPPLPGSEESDIQQNKVFAVLAYLGILFLIPLLAAPRSRFARYHTNQGLVLLLSWLAAYFVLLLIMAMPVINLLTVPLHFAVPALIFALIIIGIINAASGHYKPLPWIGHFRVLS